MPYNLLQEEKKTQYYNPINEAKLKLTLNKHSEAKPNTKRHRKNRRNLKNKGIRKSDNEKIFCNGENKIWEEQTQSYGGKIRSFGLITLFLIKKIIMFFVSEKSVVMNKINGYIHC